MSEAKLASVMKEAALTQNETSQMENCGNAHCRTNFVVHVTGKKGIRSKADILGNRRNRYKYR